MTYTFFLITGLCFSHDTYPADNLIWKNDTISIQTFPLNSWSEFDQEILFGKKEIKPDCFGCIKNYKAEWKIIGNKLFLSNIYSFNYQKDSVKADLAILFRNKFKNGLVNADWFTGELFIPKGKSTWPSRRKEYQIFESEWKITISKGEILNKKLKEKNYYQSIYTKNSDSVRIFINKHIDWNRIPVLNNEKERVYASIKTGKNKNDFKISVKSSNTKLSEEVTRVLQILPEFDYYYRHGEVFKMGYTFPIFFNETMRPK